MSHEPIISESCVETLLDKKFLRVYDLQYAPGKHYFDASRRPRNELAAIKTDAEFAEMLPDAVSCAVILHVKNEEPKLLLTYEYRYPAGRFLLSIPAGLIDPADKAEPSPILSTARREIFEETGLTVSDTDSLSIVSPIAFSSPGLTDESNALVCAQLHLNDLSALSTAGLEGGECMNGFLTVTKEDAQRLLLQGRDDHGNPYSMYTWAALMVFVSVLWTK